MKSGKQKILSVILALVVFAGCLTPAMEARADGYALYRKNITISKGEYSLIYMGKQIKGLMGRKVKVSVGDKKVLSYLIIDSGDNVVVQGLKKGSTTLTLKVKKGKIWKTYRMKVKVVNYQNPVKSFKIGSKNVVSKFKKAGGSLVYTPKAKSEKISVKPASGWKVKSITYHWDNSDKNIKIKNNSKVKYVKGVYSYLEVTLYKKETKQQENLSIEVNYGMNDNYGL